MSSDCWYWHPYEEEEKVLEMRRMHGSKEAWEAWEEKKRAEENVIAEEAFTYIPDLPEELKIQILHHLSVTLIEKLELPISTLRAVLQAREPTGTQELVKWSWMHRVVFSAELHALVRLAKKADLVPICPVVKPSIYDHSCSNFCKWFAPQGDWEAFYAKNLTHYLGRNAIEFEEEEEGEEEEEEEDFEAYESDEYDHEDSENDFGFNDDLDIMLDLLDWF